MADSPQQGRRGFVLTLGAIASSVFAAVVAVPGVAFFLDPVLRRREKGGDWLPIAPEAAVPDGRPVSLPVIGELNDSWMRAKDQRLGAVWLQKGEGEIKALSAECPHLGCAVGFDEAAGCFACPCHDARFSLNGEVLSGPSPRAMDSLEARVRDGSVEVRFQRFRTQVEDKEPV